jgi:hypothetical protein
MGIELGFVASKVSLAKKISRRQGDGLQVIRLKLIVLQPGS